MPGGHLYYEEIGRGQDLPVQLQELRPAHPSLAALRRWRKMMTTQDVAHGQLVNAMSQVRQSALDASIAPSRILLRHLDHELFDLLSDTRSPERSAMPASVKLLGDQSLVPAQERVRCGNDCHFLQALAPEWVGKRREAAAFGVSEPQAAATELSFPDVG